MEFVNNRMGHNHSQTSNPEPQMSFDITKFDFGNIFSCSLVNTALKPFAVPIANTKMRILFVSDTHMGKAIPFEQSLEIFYNELSQLVQDEQITMICHLGDLIDSSVENATTRAKEAFLKLTDLHIPLYFIGGNHDRFTLELLNLGDNEYITPLREENAILFEIPSKTEGEPAMKFYFAHDLQNNYRVVDKVAVLYVNWLKEGFADSIAPTDWLITGHTHVSTICPLTRIGCVGQFSPEMNSFAYGVLEIDQGNATFCNKIQTSKIGNPKLKFGTIRREVF